MSVTRLKRIADLFVLLSVAFGMLSLPQIYGSVPTEVFLLISLGFFLYFVIGIGVYAGKRASYPAAFVLAALALATYLPQSAHHRFITDGVLLAAARFVVGSITRALLVIIVPLYLLQQRKAPREEEAGAE